ncbi:conserved hypothetical protein [Tenacibaculum sp. 190524A02b]|uniref:Uncharacterized protein n=1 Tax=Tenacibaculum vairaonense TaxID=3137860 RepID=A0ABM9PIN5_9FLAO
MSLVKFNKDSALQRIRASFLDDNIQLSKKEAETKEKIRYVFTLRLKENHSRSSAIDMLMDEYPDISMATAYRIYNKSTFVFGELDQTDSRAERMLLREHYWGLYKEAREDKQFEVAKKILDSYRELFDFSDVDTDVDEGKLKAHEYHIKVPRDIQKIMKEQLLKGSVDFNQYPNIEDIPHEEIDGV